MLGISQIVRSCDKVNEMSNANSLEIECFSENGVTEIEKQNYEKLVEINDQVFVKYKELINQQIEKLKRIYLEKLNNFMMVDNKYSTFVNQIEESKKTNRHI